MEPDAKPRALLHPAALLDQRDVAEQTRTGRDDDVAAGQQVARDARPHRVFDLGVDRRDGGLELDANHCIGRDRHGFQATYRSRRRSGSSRATGWAASCLRWLPTNPRRGSRQTRPGYRCRSRAMASCQRVHRSEARGLRRRRLDGRPHRRRGRLRHRRAITRPRRRDRRGCRRRARRCRTRRRRWCGRRARRRWRCCLRLRRAGAAARRRPAARG